MPPCCQHLRQGQSHHSTSEVEFSIEGIDGRGLTLHTIMKTTAMNFMVVPWCCGMIGSHAVIEVELRVLREEPFCP